MNKKYRRIKRYDGADFQLHHIAIFICLFLLVLFLSSLFLSIFFGKIRIFSFSSFFSIVSFFCFMFLLLSIFFLFVSLRMRPLVTTFEVPEMSSVSRGTAIKIKSRFSEKQLVDVLKFSNKTRHGHEIPNVEVWVSDDLSEGFVAIENIANFEKMDREKIEQKISGLFSGKLRKYAVVSSYSENDESYMVFMFEDMGVSHRFIIEGDDLSPYISSYRHVLNLSNDLSWDVSQTPHISVIARTRSGKSVFAGRYLANLMVLQGWKVEYHSVKQDIYVKEFGGKSKAVEIVERAEYWCDVMDERLNIILEAGQETYLGVPTMRDVALFFDELGNLNSQLEGDKKLKSRWETAINRLTATGGSSGIHIIAISQFGTKDGFLPSVARANCSDAVIMLGGAANSADERKYLIPGFTDMSKRNYGKGQGIAYIISSGKRWEKPHYFECPWFKDL